MGIKVYKEKRPKAITDNTIQELIDWIVALNADVLIDINQISSKYEVERLVCLLVSEHTGLDIDEIELKHSITDDLGLD